MRFLRGAALPAAVIVISGDAGAVRGPKLSKLGRSCVYHKSLMPDCDASRQHLCVHRINETSCYQIKQPPFWR